MSGAEASELIAQRYRTVREIGRGGVGQVLEVFDEHERRLLALKRLATDIDSHRGREFEALFRNEYSTLAQFTHPNVVRVYEFGVDSTLFYTMELVQGEHPGAAGPMPWREVCQTLVTLCGPLALLHSRGWVHRDVAPRNVYIKADGTPKLLDFGAIAALDEAHAPMGTPACTAPETVRRERIDARTDLYGLGALGYAALTGRNAYAARTLEELPMLWRMPPPKPSDLIPGIPEAVDELILSLLCLEMNARPRQVAEVVARLIAIAELPVDGQLQLAQACLTSPGLVGREEELEQLRDALRWAQAGRAATSVVRGERGSGCTRLLDSLLVDAKVLGYQVMRANADRCGRKTFGVVRELGQRVWATDAERSGDDMNGFELALLRLDAANGGEAEALEVQRAFIALCESVCDKQPLLVVLDEADGCDAASLRLLAQLQRRARTLPLMLALSQRPLTEAVSGTMLALLEDASVVELTALDGPRVEALMRMLFGDVPNVTRVAEWIRQCTGGNFAACIAAAKGLVDTGLAKFTAGGWQLPDQLNAPQLSADTARALDTLIERLSANARELMQLFAIVSDPPLFALPRYREALPVTESELLAAEGELLANHILLATNTGYVVRDLQLLARLRSGMQPEESTLAHARLGGFYAGQSKHVHAGYHFWQAAKLTEADLQLAKVLDWRGYAADAEASDFVRSAVSIPLFEAMLAHRKQRGAAPWELFPLRMALVTLAGVSDVDLSRYAPETLAQLRLDIGLDFLNGSDPNSGANARILSCLELAKQRYDASLPEDRGLTPELGVRGIAGAVVSLSGAYALQFDPAGCATLAQLIAPLATLSPTLELVANLAEQSLRSITFDGDIRGLRERAIEITISGKAGLTAVQSDNVYYIQSYYNGLENGAEGQDHALTLAAIIEARPAFLPLGLEVRRIHALGRGDFEAAQRHRRERELLPFRSDTSEQYLQMSILRELLAAFSCRDLLELTRFAAVIDARAARFPGWQPWAALAHAFCHLTSDDPAGALAVTEHALAALAPLAHCAWSALVRTRAEAHSLLGRHREARSAMRELFAQLEARGLRPEKMYELEAALAIAEAGCGERERALTRLDRTLSDVAKRLGRSNVVYGALCEARCQVALILKDYNGFARYLQELAVSYAGHPGLRARHARWARVGKSRFYKLLGLLAAADAGATWATRLVHELPSHAAEQQGEYLLSIVLEEAAVPAGQLFRIDAGSLHLMAARPARPDARLLHAAEHYLACWAASDELQTAAAYPNASDGASASDPRHGLAPLWLTDPACPEEPVGLVLLACPLAQLAKLSPAFVRAVSEQLQSLNRRSLNTSGAPTSLITSPPSNHPTLR